LIFAKVNYLEGPRRRVIKDQDIADKLEGYFLL